MKAVHIAPRGKIELPRWRPDEHPGLQRVFGTRRKLAGLVALALVVALAIFGASVAVTPGPNDGSQVGARRQLTVDPGALAATRDQWRLLDSQMQAFKSSRGRVVPAAVTINPGALAATRDQWRLLDSQMQAFKASRGAVAPLPMVDPVPEVTPQPGMWYVGKPLPL